MKVRIVTIYDINYGNRLQNYATYKLFGNYTKDVSNRYFKDERRSVYISRPRNSKLKRFIKHFIPTAFFRAREKNTIDDSLRLEKMKKFHEFTTKYMDSEWISITKNKDFSSYIRNEDADLYITGSDQVWNPDFAGNDFYFLTFAESKKRVALSASIGYDTLEGDIMREYTAYWKSMKYISVREQSAADIIMEVTGKEVDVLLDPTMLLPKADWEEIITKPQFEIPERYILVLFLGEVSSDLLENYRTTYQMELIILNNKKYRDYYLADPSEFLYLLKNAALVLTDSFHCAVFSIIFHKQFWIYKRESNLHKDMFTRMETLLKRMNYIDRVQEINSIINTEQISDERFLYSDDVMLKERERTMKIITSLLGGTDKHEN